MTNIRNSIIMPIEGEIWKDIKSHESYQISNLGRVKSTMTRYGNKREKLLKETYHRQGYKVVTLGRKNHDNS